MTKLREMTTSIRQSGRMDRKMLDALLADIEDDDEEDHDCDDSSSDSHEALAAFSGRLHE